MKVLISDIEKITITLLEKLKEKKGEWIEFNNDFYWDISDEEIFDPYSEPVNITLGQLSDELDEICKMKDNNDSSVYDFRRLSIIFKAISIENPTAF